MAHAEIIYARELTLHPDEFIDVLKRSTLAERRPVDDVERIRGMCQNASLIVTARVDGKLVGVARSITDFVYCTYLSDLAVDESLQKQGIGTRLIKETKLHSPQAKLILLSAPAAVNYYPKIGMTRHDNCFLLDNVNDLKIAE
ncbi:GNAT family N-acetyltransferase [Mucilaginibacter sp. OK098]|uniref:GNAT family N-acetyltransferase n=1 Tax=Mucilaginibacter sp. OK098 TaxID=1855297 RepID=UPI000913A35E|nr:GNAT family N-acetyltransferase [Mucilaginibacter sp. OK098]SHM21044.1 Predicted N-acetyltransferase YhbS [Mucilaginibacter sp. OK098]